MPRILQICEDEQELDNVTCIGDETLKEMCFVQFKERNQQLNMMSREEELGGILLLEDVHACKSACWPNYFDGCVDFCKAILMCVKSRKEKESYYDTKTKTRSHWSGSVKEIKNRELFIFLPWKEKTREAARRSPKCVNIFHCVLLAGAHPIEIGKILCQL